MSRIVRDSRGSMQTPCRSTKDPMLGTRSCGLSNAGASVSEQKVPGRIERRAAIRAHLPAVVVSEGSRISRGLWGERGCLAGSEIVSYRAKFESRRVGRICEGIQP
ncbi:hypothetical protein AAFF_G00288810 [Aldrovandia affinis]|uniref:Uncharacterized protein n=1 Tax=Aldrovandia affinis TaxID=143900 RepID=A0AAD7WSA9_9TELE|nr:hypothetical protein AAFF_G00288810 [Aldrovandia affinis]